MFNQYNNIDNNTIKNELNNIPKWYIHQINNDLNIFNKHHLSSNNLDKIMINNYNSINKLVRFKILSNKLYFSKYNIESMYGYYNVKSKNISNQFKIIVSILNKIKIFVNDVDFIISLQDCVLEQENIEPILSFAKDINNEYEKYNILIPDILTLRGTHINSFSSIQKTINKSKTDFKDKINKIVWRGSFNRYYRTLFLKLSKDCNFIDCDVNYLNYEKQQNYKYQIVFDGLRCTYPGYLWRLYSNCVTIKHESSHVQWFYNNLKPYVHYIPLKKDFNKNELIKLFNWLNNNYEKCLKISKNSKLWVKKNISDEKMLVYYIILLNNYSNIQKCSKDVSDFSLSPLYFCSNFKKIKYLLLIIINNLIIFILLIIILLIIITYNLIF